MKNNNKLRLFTGLATLFFATSTMADVNYYLAPTGDDKRGNGSASKPWKTLHKAQNAVRNIPKPLTENVNVILADGRYELASTLEFGESDSGNAKYKVTYKAENKGKALISAGSLVTGWHDNDNDGIWQAKVEPGIKTRELYVAGKTATRARSVDGKGWRRDGHDGFYQAPPEAANWKNQDKIELAVTFLWKHYKGPIASIDGTKVTMKPEYWELAKIGPFGIVDMRAKHVNWVENAFELLDEEGEWYHNETTNILYYKPKAGQKLTGKNAVDVVLPRLEQLVSANGASHVTFDGLKFSHNSWLGASGDQGYVSIQTGTILDDTHWATIEDAFDGLQEIPGAINLLHTKHFMFKNGAISNVGGNAVLIDRGSQYNTFFNNEVSYVSAASFVVGNPIDSHARPDYLIKNNVIDNNNIFNTGLVFVDTASAF